VARLALKVDVDTYVGTARGIPPLLDLFDRLGVRATFLFSVGPDNTGRAIRRIFRPGFFGKVRRTSVVSNYGLRTLLNGTLLPGPQIGRKLGHVMQAALRRGHEVGLHAYDHVAWQDRVAERDRSWTLNELDKGMDAFHSALGTAPSTIGAAGWQVNAHVPELEDRLGFDYASDTRGERPFRPLTHRGDRARCVQLPTTLPTLDELLGTVATDVDDLVRTLLGLTEDASRDQVFTLHAELEGLRYIDCFERLLVGWRNQGHDPGRLQDNYNALDVAVIDAQRLGWTELPGRTGRVAAAHLETSLP
jgi:undecaprenyl phosphate-alpha-L-ara4FN deformylase